MTNHFRMPVPRIWWPFRVLLRVLDRLAAAGQLQHERTVRARIRQCRHPVHVLKLRAGSGGQLIFSASCRDCEASTAHYFATRSVPLDDRLGTDIVSKLVNVSGRRLFVLANGVPHVFVPETTPADLCDAPDTLRPESYP
jgi:hypothetical protein